MSAMRWKGLLHPIGSLNLGSICIALDSVGLDCTPPSECVDRRMCGLFPSLFPLPAMQCEAMKLEARLDLRSTWLVAPRRWVQDSIVRYGPISTRLGQCDAPFHRIDMTRYIY